MVRTLKVPLAATCTGFGPSPRVRSPKVFGQAARWGEYGPSLGSPDLAVNVRTLGEGPCGERSQPVEEPNALRRYGDNISALSVIGSYLSQQFLLVMGQPLKIAQALGIIIMTISWGGVPCTQLCHNAYAARSLLSPSYPNGFPYKK